MAAACSASRESDVCFSAAKLFFAYGLGNALTFPLWAGASVVLMAERPTPDAVFKRWTGGAGPKPTLFFGAPTGYAGMLVSPALPKRSEVALRLCSSAGEALPRELGERFSAHFGCELIDGIGSTEMLHIFLSNRPGDVHYGSTGKPVPGYTIELRGDDGRPVPDGEVGDLYIGGPSAALMYWGNRDKSRDTFQGAWTKSGDKYVRNADGTYTYSGRSDDMLKVSGQYVSPFEVEATLVQHAAVLEAAVIGVPDAEGLTRAKAFVVLKPGQQRGAGARGRAQGLRQDAAGAVQVPAPDRVHRRAAEDRDRQDPALSPARARSGQGALSQVDGASGAFVELPWSGRRVRIEVQRIVPASPRAGRADARVPARGPRLGGDVARLSAAAVRRRGRARPRLLAPRLRPLDAARPAASAGAWTSCTARRTRCCPRCSTSCRSIATRSRPGCSATATAARSRCCTPRAFRNGWRAWS